MTYIFLALQKSLLNLKVDVLEYDLETDVLVKDLVYKEFNMNHDLNRLKNVKDGNLLIDVD